MNMDSFMMSVFSNCKKGEVKRGEGRHCHETKGKLSPGRSQIVDLPGNQKIMTDGQKQVEKLAKIWKLQKG